MFVSSWFSCYDQNNITGDESFSKYLLITVYDLSYSDAEFVDRTLSHGDAEALEVLEGLWNCLKGMNAGGKRPANWEDCVTWARREWEIVYSNEIRQLLHCFPPDMVNHLHCTAVGIHRHRGRWCASQIFAFQSINCYCNRVWAKEELQVSFPSVM